MIVATIADYATLVATVIAVAGIVSLWFSRPRFSKNEWPRSKDVLTVSFTQDGSGRARNVEYMWGIRRSTTGGRGDGHAIALGMGRQSSFNFTFHREGQYFADWEPDPAKEVRVAVPNDCDGIYFAISYQRTFVPWLRRSLRFVVSIDSNELGQLNFTVVKHRPGQKWPPF